MRPCLEVTFEESFSPHWKQSARRLVAISGGDLSRQRCARICLGDEVEHRESEKGYNPHYETKEKESYSADYQRNTRNSPK